MKGYYGSLKVNNDIHLKEVTRDFSLIRKKNLVYVLRRNETEIRFIGKKM